MDSYTLTLPHLLLFAQSLGIGFLIGLERERSKNQIAGLRTFSLIALSGSLAGYISTGQQLPEIALVLLLVVAGSLMVAQFKSKAKEPDTTTVLAGILTFGLGYILWLGHPILAAALAVAITAILYFRQTLREVPQKLTHTDISSFLQFAAIVVVLLPVLPDATYGPYQVFNPYKTGWLVVLTSGISLAGYVALRMQGGKSKLLFVGLLGGLISTTATTMIYAKHSNQIKGFSPVAATIILLSHLMLFIRVAIVVSVVEFTMLKPMLPWLTGGLLAGLCFVSYLYWQVASNALELPELEVSNPAELKAAFGFALAFVVILLLVAWMNDVFADTGVLVVAFISGLTDLDAITISNLKLVGTKALAIDLAVHAIIIAFIANLVFKFGIVVTLADKQLRRPILLGFSLLVVGALSGLYLG
jgi:uncharacterized membrane protein (DUF4010 family)